MTVPASIFLEFAFPNATTWFYFSFLLAVALFFKFSRLLSIRNWDVLSLFLLVPGLLLVVEAQGQNRGAYIWLLCASGYFVLRCLVDLTLVQRPALEPNLSLGGLAWLAGTLFLSLVLLAVRPTPTPFASDAPASPVLNQVSRQGTQGIKQLSDAQNLDVGNDASLWVQRILAVSCHLAIVIGLVCIGWRHFQDIHAGMAAATFYLLLPYTTLYVTQWYHIWPMALLIWAVAAYRFPMVAGLVLGLAAGSVYFPLLVLPVWGSFYWRRGLGRFAAAFFLGIMLCIGFVGLLAWVQGDWPLNLFTAMPADIRDWHPWFEVTQDTPGFWTGLHWAYRLPIFVAYLALVLMTAIWPMPKNLAHVLALSAATLIGTQFWYAREGGVYVVWYLPFLTLLTFRPNLVNCQPPPINPETDWLRRVGGRLWRGFVWALGLAKPVDKVRS